MTGACTIVSPNYLHFARTLAVSYRLHHPDHPFFVLLVADITDRALFKDEPFTVVLLNDLGVPNLRKIAMKYEILELNTNVKPTFMKYLLATFGLSYLSYLDPDICVYRRLDPVFDGLKSASIVLTPHLTAPIVPDGRFPGEQDMLYNGTFNLGFIAVKRDAEAGDMLDWWESRCLNEGFSEGRTGLFVDQKWINLVPGCFSGVHILRNPGCNMAYWNLHERMLSEGESGIVVNLRFPLCFYHFSGVVLDDPDVVSAHTNRFTLTQRPDLEKIFSDYRKTLKLNRVQTRDSMPYGFDRFTDGTVVTLLARRIYSTHPELQTHENPFNSEGTFYYFCKRHGLLSGKEKTQKSTWRQFNPEDRRVLAVHTSLKIILKLLGPNRYELLMRYLSHIAVLRNQAVFIKD